MMQDSPVTKVTERPRQKIHVRLVSSGPDGRAEIVLGKGGERVTSHVRFGKDGFWHDSAGKPLRGLEQVLRAMHTVPDVKRHHEQQLSPNTPNTRKKNGGRCRIKIIHGRLSGNGHDGVHLLHTEGNRVLRVVRSGHFCGETVWRSTLENRSFIVRQRP